MAKGANVKEEKFMFDDEIVTLYGVAAVVVIS